jgi:transposase
VAGAHWRRRQRADHAPRHAPRGLVLQKKSLTPSERNDEQRAVWHEETSALHPQRLHWIDEFGVYLDLTRRYGWAPRGQRATEAVPRRRGRVTSVIASLSLDGIGPVLARHGATNTERFLEYLREHLCPQLRPGDIVLLDNAGAHLNRQVRATVEAVGAEVRYLPPYSPDFNPLELAISAIKAELRRVKPRSGEGLADALPAALATVTSKDAGGFFRHCGYHERDQPL